MKNLAIFLLVIFISISAQAFRNDEELPPEQEDTAQEIFKQIRCLVCDGESLAESNADLAYDMRQVIRKEITQGKTEDEIINGLTDKYGDRILQKPPVRTDTMLLWIAPAIIVLIGIFALVGVLRGKKNASK